MTDKHADGSAVRTALNSPRVTTIVVISCVALILFTAIEYASPTLFGGVFVMKDYDAFFVAGQMFWEGRLEDAYFAERLFLAQAEIVGGQGFMPWTYPPHFNAVTAILALMPVWFGYAVFTTSTLLFYLLMLRRLAPDYFTVVLLFTFPAVMVCIRTGQNGFLVAGLMGLFVIGLQGSQMRAIFALALLSIKPHFLPAVYLLAALRGQWIVVLGGLVGTAFLLLIATLVFGFGIWPAFQNAVRESGIFLREGFYPLFRMTSLYAVLHDLGVPPNVALATQGLLALTALGMVLLAKTMLWQAHRLLATAMMASLFISPYAYDYDLQILGVALALLMPDIWAKASANQLLALLGGCWLASISLLFSWMEETSRFVLRSDPPVLNFWFLLPVCIYSLWIAQKSAKLA